MDIPVIMIVSLVSLLLGVINILWGPNILGRRPKVVVLKDPYLDFDLIPERDAVGSVRLTNLKIRAHFKLVRTRGDKDLLVTEAYLRLNEQLHKQFKRYFPPNFPYLRFKIPKPVKLQLNEPCSFEYEIELAGTELGSRLFDLPQEKRKFDEIASKMEEEYEICWKYADGTVGKYKCEPLGGVFNRYWASYNWVFKGWVKWSQKVKRLVGRYPSRSTIRIRVLARLEKESESLL